MEKSNLKVGDTVFFGRRRGEKSKGEIVKLNPKRAKVRLLESRGRNKLHAPGGLWNVPYSLIYENKGTIQGPQRLSWDNRMEARYS